MEYGRSRKLYDRPEFLSPQEIQNSEKTEKSDLENKVPLSRGRGLTNVLQERLASIPGKKTKKANCRVNGSFIAGICHNQNPGHPAVEVNEETLRAKERVFFRALMESGFRQISDSGKCCVARTRGCYKWKIALRASTSYEAIIVLDESQVRLHLNFFCQIL